MAEIRVENLHKSFGGFVAVRDSSFVVEDGTFFCLLGPSGCGKTTTLRMIAGLELPTSGRILLGSEDVTGRRARARDIAFVFQLFALYPHMSVRKNIAYPLVSVGMPRSAVRTRVEEAARILQITGLLDRKVSGLSGGDRQRVALGRAIVRQPKAFLMDEPLGALDSEFRHVMCGELRALHERLRATTVYVTHDQLEAMSLGDRIAVMNHGVVEQIGTPQEVYDRPASLFVADFIGSPPMNLLPCRDALAPGQRALRLGECDVPIPAAREALPMGERVLGVRPEHVRLRDDAPLRGEVYGTEYLGTTQIVTIRTAQGLVRARLAASEIVQVGAAVGLAFRTERLSVFDAASGRAVRTALGDAAPVLEQAHG